MLESGTVSNGTVAEERESRTVQEIILGGSTDGLKNQTHGNSVTNVVVRNKMTEKMYGSALYMGDVEESDSEDDYNNNQLGFKQSKKRRKLRN